MQGSLHDMALRPALRPALDPALRPALDPALDHDQLHQYIVAMQPLLPVASDCLIGPAIEVHLAGNLPLEAVVKQVHLLADGTENSVFVLLLNQNVKDHWIYQQDVITARLLSKLSIS